MQEKSEKVQTILVVDDEPTMLRLLERILTSEGYNVLLAADGNYAMTLVKDSSPDLVLLDIVMSGPDGFMTLDMIRKHSAVPVIMVTARHNVESLQKAIELGADDYINKPFNPTELLARVHAKLRRA